MKHRNDSNAYKLLVLSRRRRHWAIGLTVSLLILFCGGWVMANIPETFLPEERLDYDSSIVLICLAMVFLTLVLFRKLKHCSARQAAVEIDKNYRGGSRMEAMAELEKSDNPLADLQARDAIRFYSKAKLPSWRIFQWILPALLICLSGSQMSFIALEMVYPDLVTRREAVEYVTQLRAREEKMARRLEQIRKKRQDEKISPGFAKLRFTEPESEVKATCIDELCWAAEAASTHGFKELYLTVSINGGEEQVVELDSAVSPEKTGRFVLEGSLYLDLFELEPFDVVGYMLRGVSRIGRQDGSVVCSIPRFVLIRPFKEEAYLAKAEGGFMKSQGGKLMLNALRLELEMVKANYAAKSVKNSLQKKEFEEAVVLLQKKQLGLAEEIEAALAGPEAMSLGIPSPIMKCLEDAAASMRKAAGELATVVSNQEGRQ